LALQVGEFLDEPVIYSYGSCMTLTSTFLLCKLQACPLIREGTLHEEEKQEIDTESQPTCRRDIASRPSGLKREGKQAISMKQAASKAQQRSEKAKVTVT
jgi:hypothetical protein